MLRGNIILDDAGLQHVEEHTLLGKVHFADEHEYCKNMTGSCAGGLHGQFYIAFGKQYIL